MSTPEYKATVEDLAGWIRDNSSLSDSSVYKYSRAVNTISNDMLRAGVIPISLFEMPMLQLDIFLPLILSNASFQAKNATGNNMYSNALKQYRLFRSVATDTAIDQKEVEKVITGFDSLSETERTSLVKSRIGQGVFRDRLIEKYDGACIITGISLKKLLIASHVKPWAVSNNDERLSEDNGLLLSPTYDKLFDCGLISFFDNGRLLISSQISQTEMNRLRIDTVQSYNIKMTTQLKDNLEYHRDVVFVK